MLSGVKVLGASTYWLSSSLQYHNKFMMNSKRQVVLLLGFDISFD
jgi:hypothetical protein